VRAASKIYESDGTDGYEWVIPVNDEGMELFLTFDGTPRLHQWHPVRMKLLSTLDEQKKLLKRADFPWFGSDALCLRPEAVCALGNLLTEYGELLPLCCGSTELYAWNVTTVVDALDMDRSKVIRFTNSERVMTITEHVFRSDIVQGLHAFKIPQAAAIYVDNYFVARVTDAGLTGLSFRQVWAPN